MEIYKKFKRLIQKIIYISDFTNVQNKTVRILASIIFANLSVALDILIIITFSNILIGEISYENEIILLLIEIIQQYSFIFPIVVCLCWNLYLYRLYK